MTMLRSGALTVSLGLGLLLGTPASADGVERLFVVDFEGFAELTPISNQYESLGVLFSLEGSPIDWPIIATAGAPTIAFGGGSKDRPMASGNSGLTDALLGDDPTMGRNIVMKFDPPVTSVGMFIIDVDQEEVFRVRALDGGAQVDIQTRTGDAPDTGDTVSTPLRLAADRITSVVIEVSSNVGFAVDFVTFTRPEPAASCGARLEVAQETLPGAGNFDDNVLGYIAPFPASATISEFYAYDLVGGAHWNGRSLDPAPDRSHILFADTFDGRCLVIIHDDHEGDDDGGNAEMAIELADTCHATRAVEDDPVDLEAGGYLGDAGESSFSAAHRWGPTGADGFAISRLDGDGTVIIRFAEVDGSTSTPPLAGLTHWVACSADGGLVALALQTDRRVRIRAVDERLCPQDVNCDGQIDFTDLLEVMSLWGSCE